MGPDQSIRKYAKPNKWKVLLLVVLCVVVNSNTGLLLNNGVNLHSYVITNLFIAENALEAISN